MLSLNYSPIKEVVGYPLGAMRARKDSLFVYPSTLLRTSFKMAEQILKEVSPSIENPEAVQALCLAWQYNHLSYLPVRGTQTGQAKSAKQRLFLLQERDFCLSYAEALLEDHYQQSKELLSSNLDNVIRSSSLIETINSLIRPYPCFRRGNITQEALNLIMFYHNHRRFVDGKRKGKAPIELLTGKKLNQHWIDLLVNQSG